MNPDLFTVELSTLLYQFKEADNFGSLIRPELNNIPDVLRLIDEKKVADDIFLQDIHQRVLKVLKQADYLSPKYHVVITNPPYMSGKGMNGRLGVWAKNNYSNSKSDLFAMFIKRNFELSLKNGLTAMVTQQTWMFLSSFSKLRQEILSYHNISTLIQIGFNSFPELNSKLAIACAFVIKNSSKESIGSYINLNDAPLSADKAQVFLIKKQEGDIYWVKKEIFSLIPGNPISYWASDKAVNSFKKHKQIYECSISEGQNITANNNKYLRMWWEIDKNKIEAAGKWSFYSKGGDYRKWFGNLNHVVDWSEDARRHYHSHSSARIIPKYLRFREGITWTLISLNPSFRLLPSYATFDKGGSSIFFNDSDELKKCLLFLNTKISGYLTRLFNASLNLQVDDVRKLPLSPSLIEFNKDTYNRLLYIAKKDWDDYETSRNFKNLALLQSEHNKSNIASTFSELLQDWQKRTKEMKQLEEENNRNFIKIYDLQDEIRPELQLNEITLTCNPYYRYDDKKEKDELERLLLSDTIKEFISYSVGCMFGRYSLDKEGLILATEGDTIENYFAKIPEPTFKADDDNVIPIMDVDWFPDDIAERFKRFLKVTFGEDHYTENLDFIEKAIGKDIRKFFLKDFYTYHVKMYKKRPIYWMFSSPKGSFNALIYMHRYRPDTVSVVLNDYLREFRTKLTARKENLENISINTSASQGEKTKALKEIEQIKKVLDEIDDYERDILYPLATKQIEIDLDDGVKENYPKFGKALKKVIGLSEQ